MYLVKVPTLIQKLFPEVVWTCTHDQALHLTFDDGPDPESTPRILALLDQLNLQATFFCLGERIEKYPQLYADIIEAGHQIGHHGYRHLSGWNTSLSDYLENADKSKRLTHSDLYRPPYGRMTYEQYKHIKQENTIVAWSLMPGDFDTKVQEARLSQRFTQKEPTSIVVLHDTPTSFHRMKRILRQHL